MTFNYTLNWSNESLKPSFTLTAGTIDTNTTSLALTGKVSANWGIRLQENLLALLENFASNTPPASPTYGQLWYDTGTETLKMLTTSNVWVIIWPTSGGGTSTPTPTPTGTGTPTPSPTPTPTPTPAPNFIASSLTSVGSPGNMNSGSLYSLYGLVTSNISLSAASLVSGSLPTGTMLAVNGTDAVLNGTPSVNGVYTGTVRVQQITAATPSLLDRTFYILVGTPSFDVTAPYASTPLALTNGVYVPSVYIITTNLVLNSSTYYPTLVAGSTLPPGMSIGPNGPNITLFGTPTANGTYSGTINVTNDAGASPWHATGSYVITVTSASTSTPTPTPTSTPTPTPTTTSTSTPTPTTTSTPTPTTTSTPTPTTTSTPTPTTTSTPTPTPTSTPTPTPTLAPFTATSLYPSGSPMLLLASASYTTDQTIITTSDILSAATVVGGTLTPNMVLETVGYTAGLSGIVAGTLGDYSFDVQVTDSTGTRTATVTVYTSIVPPTT